MNESSKYLPDETTSTDQKTSPKLGKEDAVVNPAGSDKNRAATTLPPVQPKEIASCPQTQPINYKNLLNKNMGHTRGF